MAGYRKSGKHAAFVAFAACTASLLLAAMPGRAQTPPGEELFNGRDFQGWDLFAGKDMPPEGAFTVLAGGVIASTGQPTGFLATAASYHNYRLHVEWRWTGKPGNGGVLLHISPGPMDRVWPLSLQVQTRHGSAGDLLPMAGYAYAEPATSAPGAQPVVKARTAPDSEKPAGEWNSADIVCRDGAVDVAINGVPQNRISQGKPDRGRIGFQLEGAPYELRNVRLEKID